MCLGICDPLLDVSRSIDVATTHKPAGQIATSPRVLSPISRFRCWSVLKSLSHTDSDGAQYSEKIHADASLLRNSHGECACTPKFDAPVTIEMYHV